MFAMVEAFKRGGKVEWDPKTENLRASVGSNPIIVNLTQNFGAKPRGHGKYDFSQFAGQPVSQPEVLCLYCDGVSADRVYCQRYGADWVPTSKCSTCPKNRLQKKGEVRA